jgi:hypothetical protein
MIAGIDKAPGYLTWIGVVIIVFAINLIEKGGKKS